DLNKVIRRFTCTDILHHCTDISDSVDNGNLDFHISNCQSGFLQSTVAPDRVIIDLIHFTAGELPDYGTQGCLHNAAGGSEDPSGSAALSHELVKLCVWNGSQIDSAQFE